MASFDGKILNLVDIWKSSEFFLLI